MLWLWPLTPVYHWVHRLVISSVSEQLEWICAVAVWCDYSTDLFSSDHCQQRKACFSNIPLPPQQHVLLLHFLCGWWTSSTQQTEAVIVETPTCMNAITRATQPDCVIHRCDLVISSWGNNAFNETFQNRKTDPLWRSFLNSESFRGWFISLPC